MHIFWRAKYIFHLKPLSQRGRNSFDKCLFLLCFSCIWTCLSDNFHTLILWKWWVYHVYDADATPVKRGHLFHLICIKHRAPETHIRRILFGWNRSCNEGGYLFSAYGGGIIGLRRICGRMWISLSIFFVAYASFLCVYIMQSLYLNFLWFIVFVSLYLRLFLTHTSLLFVSEDV